VLAGQTDQTQVALTVCEGETVNYNGQTLAAGDSFTWVGLNQSGCDSTVTVSVSGLPPVSFALSASQICWNALDGSIAVGNIGGSTGPYLFSLDGSTYQPDTLFTGLPPGDYSVYLQDQNGCVFDETTSIGAVPPLTVQAEDKTLVCGGEVMLDPLVVSELPLTWEWADSSGVISTEAEVMVGTPGTYLFTATNDCETASGQVQVTVEPLSAFRLVYLPNSFSPNGDGINDCFRGYTDPDLDIVRYELKIFDRWGELLFETADIEGCYDGMLDDKELRSTVLVYWVTLVARNCDGELEQVLRKGDIHLVR
jgi:gliding motility-associated-like protein